MAAGADRDNSVERAAENQALFREINERVRALNESFAGLLPMGDWVCECAQASCVERIEVAHDEYEALRNVPGRFAVAPNDRHVFPALDRVVGRYETYWVVERA
jgi:hypothetical protein